MTDRHEIFGTYAELEERMDYEPAYRIHLNGRATRWAGYESVFCLEGVYFISPYYTEHNDWRQVTAEEALGYLTTGEDSEVAHDDHEVEAPADDWIGWPGGECPLLPNQPAEYRTREYGTHSALAGHVRWGHTPPASLAYGGDIVAYRKLEAVPVNCWMVWAGGECPVAPDALVEYRMRNGECSRDQAQDIRWGHGVPSIAQNDVVGYWVVSDGWLPWAGGDCPVPADEVVEYRMRGSKDTHGGEAAGTLRWTHGHVKVAQTDIVAYRVVEAAPEVAWIDWAGGQQPVPNGTTVQYRTREGRVFTQEAQWLWWVHFEQHDSQDIVAYRVVPR